MILTRRYNVDRFGYLIPHRYGNLPVLGAVATFRPGEGKFGRGAVAVEEGTENLADIHYIDHALGRSSVVVVNGGLPEGEYTISFDYEDIEIESRTGFLIYAGESLGVVPRNDSKGKAEFTFNIGPDNAGKNLTIYAGSWHSASVENHVIFSNIQIEAKPFATSFVDGTRAAGRLEYPQSIWNHATGTFAAWVKTPTNVTTDRVLTLQWAKDDIGAHTRFGIRMNTSGRFVVSYGSIDTLTTADSYNDGEWHHVALTWVNGTADVHLYVDGERVASADSPISVSNPGGRWGGVIPIGHRGYSYRDQWWNGLIDELLVLPYAASEEEIVSWYEAQGPLSPHPQALLQWDRQTVRPAQMVKL